MEPGRANKVNEARFIRWSVGFAYLVLGHVGTKGCLMYHFRVACSAFCCRRTTSCGSVCERWDFEGSGTGPSNCCTFLWHGQWSCQMVVARSPCDRCERRLLSGERMRHGGCVSRRLRWRRATGYPKEALFDTERFEQCAEKECGPPTARGYLALLINDALRRIPAEELRAMSTLVKQAKTGVRKHVARATILCKTFGL